MKTRNELRMSPKALENGKYEATSENWMLTLTKRQTSILYEVAERGLHPQFDLYRSAQ